MTQQCKKRKKKKMMHLKKKSCSELEEVEQMYRNFSLKSSLSLKRRTEVREMHLFHHHYFHTFLSTASELAQI